MLEVAASTGDRVVKNEFIPKASAMDHPGLWPTWLLQLCRDYCVLEATCYA